MLNQIERAIDLAAVTIIAEMYTDSINVVQIASLIQKIVSGIEEQPSAEMLIEFISNKYK